MKRLAIYVIYDKDGIIDDYIIYFLKELSKSASRLVCVCNGKLQEEGREKLSKYANGIFERPNIGYDGGAVKDVLTNCLGWDEAYKYDELLIANDTFYGPLFPISEIFDKMDKLNVDFWGIAEQKNTNSFRDYANKEVSPFVQSYFINFKQNVIKSKGFREFFENLQIDNFSDAVTKYELLLTEVLLKSNFKYSVFTDLSEEFSQELQDNYLPILQNVNKSITEYNYPFVKIKSLERCLARDLQLKSGESHYGLLDYIKEYTNYDVNLILKHFLRIKNNIAIKESLRLNFILSAETLETCELNIKDKKIAIIFDIQNAPLFSRFSKYVYNIPDYIDVFYSMDKNIFEVYDYACFLSDKGMGNVSAPAQESYMHNLFENTIASKVYIKNVINLFEKKAYIGILKAPKPYHSDYFVDLMEETEDEDHPCAFWRKKDAYKNDKSYLTGTVSSIKSASVRLMDLEYGLKKLYGKLPAQQQMKSLAKTLKQIDLENIIKFRLKYKELYIYGAGNAAAKMANAFENENMSFDAFIVSDGKSKPDEFMGHKVIYLSDIKSKKSDCGIVLGLDERNAKQVAPILSAEEFFYIAPQEF